MRFRDRFNLINATGIAQFDYLTEQLSGVNQKTIINSGQISGINSSVFSNTGISGQIDALNSGVFGQSGISGQFSSGISGSNSSIQSLNLQLQQAKINGLAYSIALG
jgi:hypothetical protein